MKYDTSIIDKEIKSMKRDAIHRQCFSSLRMLFYVAVFIGIEILIVATLIGLID